jgi:hypothetical protein
VSPAWSVCQSVIPRASPRIHWNRWRPRSSRKIGSRRPPRVMRWQVAPGHATLKLFAMTDEWPALRYVSISSVPSTQGPTGMDLWQNLVLGAVRLELDADWDRMEHTANYDSLVRKMLGLRAGAWSSCHRSGKCTSTPCCGRRGCQSRRKSNGPAPRAASPIRQPGTIRGGDCPQPIFRRGGGSKNDSSKTGRRRRGWTAHETKVDEPAPLNAASQVKKYSKSTLDNGAM